MFNAQDWYWNVAGDMTKVYSSKRNTYVDPASDADYAAWSQAGNATIAAQNEGDIWYYTKNFMPLWLWNGATMSQPGVGVYTKDQLNNYNALVRYNKVAGGTTAAGIPIKTDDLSRGYVQGGRALAEADSTFHTSWYGSDGNFYPVDAPTMIQMSNALGTHTNNCYMIFSQTADAITKGNITTTGQIDSAYSGVR
jgi:Domain of unknown function (DUF4376)